MLFGALDGAGGGWAAWYAGVFADAAFCCELCEVGADVVVGGAAEAWVDLGVELEHDFPAGECASALEEVEDLALAHVAVFDVHLEAFAGVVDDAAVAGADDAKVGELEEALEGAAVACKVRDGGGGAPEEGIAGEEDAFFFEVVAEGIDGVAGGGEYLQADAAIEGDDVAVAEGGDVAGDAAFEEGTGVGRDGDLGIEGFFGPLEVAGVVGVVVGDGSDGDLFMSDGGEVAFDEPSIAVDGFAGVDGDGLSAGFADEVDAGELGMHRVVVGDEEGADGGGDLHGGSTGRLG